MTKARKGEGVAGLRRFKRYPAYKDSGVEWLGEVPAHWEVHRLKTIASVRLSNVDKKSADGQELVRLCNYVDVYYNERITPDLDFMAATATPEQVRHFSLSGLIDDELFHALLRINCQLLLWLPPDLLQLVQHERE